MHLSTAMALAQRSSPGFDAVAGTLLVDRRHDVNLRCRFFARPTPRQAHFRAARPFRLFAEASGSGAFRPTWPPRPPQSLFLLARYGGGWEGGGSEQHATTGPCAWDAVRVGPAAPTGRGDTHGGGIETRQSGATAPADSPAADWFGAPVAHHPARARGSANA